MVGLGIRNGSTCQISLRKCWRPYYYENSFVGNWAITQNWAVGFAIVSKILSGCKQEKKENRFNDRLTPTSYANTLHAPIFRPTGAVSCHIL